MFKVFKLLKSKLKTKNKSGNIMDLMCFAIHSLLFDLYK